MMAPPPEWPTRTTGASKESIFATTASMWVRRPMPARGASADSRPGNVSGWTLWPAAVSGGVTWSHDEASNQNPGTRMMSMPVPYRSRASLTT